MSMAKHTPRMFINNGATNGRYARFWCENGHKELNAPQCRHCERCYCPYCDEDCKVKETFDKKVKENASLWEQLEKFNS